ncbi:hypothetical protein D6T64_03135 [Cryobacterium melibiosiphilum]|uniref:PH domain-containing protein n=1 Tax=Cryobacterium melibiosiphilum TaxID=995039 RepID=A0A3A5MP61_9MICO|nr:hypothetical protein [Cryobacterium melibiosiphilum]RJT90871.1 hypothetical protein D6T64_03135 [Cryobacterium melibiosiphilum]
MQLLRAEASVYRTIGLGVLALFAPIFAVLYWLMIPAGTWLWVASAQLVATLACLAALLGAYRAYVRVGASGLSERGILGHVSNVGVSDVASVILLDLYRSAALDTQPQLFVVGHSGELLMRMRGQFWTQEAMDTVVDELGAPVTRVPEPLTLLDLNRWKPGLLYWFERRHVPRAAA